MSTPAPIPLSDLNRCCPPLGRAPLGRAEAEKLAQVLKALADPARLQLVAHIAAAETAVCACDLNDVVHLTQPTVSHHLSTLVRAGILLREKRGVWAYYRPVPGALAAVAAILAGASPGAVS